MRFVLMLASIKLFLSCGFSGIVLLTLFATPSMVFAEQVTLNLSEQSCEGFLSDTDPPADLDETLTSATGFPRGSYLVFDSQRDFDEGNAYLEIEADSTFGGTDNRIILVSSLVGSITFDADVSPNAELSILDSQQRCVFSLGLDLVAETSTLSVSSQYFSKT